MAGTIGPSLGVFLGVPNSNAHGRESFIDHPSDVASLSDTYPYFAVDMQAYLFPGGLTDTYDVTSPAFAAGNGDAAWYLADLLEHNGITWGGWSAVLHERDAYADRASQLRLYPIQELVNGS